MMVLDPLTLSLNKNALIEASAGTGKTYTITTLYLRAILGLNDTDSSTLEPLSIDQILVVTFTEAATQELRDRIRSKLKETQQRIVSMMASKDFTLRINEEVSSDPLKELILQYVSLYQKDQPKAEIEQAILNAYHRIQDSITLIDDAAIYTIHGFCQRCLNQFAFETKIAFEQQFEMDNSLYLKQALHDFWRTYAIPLSGLEYQLFRNYWRSPKVLFDELNELLGRQVTITPSLESSDYTVALSQFTEALTKLHEELQDSDFVAAITNSGLKKNSAPSKKVFELTQFVSAPIGRGDCISLPLIEAYSQVGLGDIENYKKNADVVEHPVVELFESLLYQAKKLLEGQFKGYWLDKAKRFIESSSTQLKAQQQVLTPDDLLMQLESAIHSDSPDEVLASQRLANSIRKRYPLAFIDEFQDTDPTQYTIFSQIYNPKPEKSVVTRDHENGDVIEAEEVAQGNMIMIGDPKQAIYRFRGADIFTYIQAKEQLDQSQHFTLSTNWRSNWQLIEAVNHFFDNSKTKFEHDAIPFHPVMSGNKLYASVANNGADLPKLSINHINAPVSENKPSVGYTLSEASPILAKHCASEIRDLLESAQQGKALIGSQLSEEVQKKPVEAKDIAVLVRNRYQAKQIKESLLELGVHSVYIARDSVFERALAKDLLRLIEAIHAPNNEKAIKNAIATCYFDYSLEQQVNLQHNSKDWHRHISKFHHAHELWQTQKLSAAINEVCTFANSFKQWQKEHHDFERMITDHRHLLELIQNEAAIISGSEKLMSWLRQSVTDSSSANNDDATLRLESDSNLVQIVTMHGSKGLEYPIVYIPFATEFKSPKTALYYCERTNRLSYRVDKGEKEYKLAERDRLMEDIRLLYVAMTRAKLRLVMGCFNVKERWNSASSSTEKSAFGRLILGDEQSKVSEEVWCEALKGYFEKKTLSDIELTFYDPQEIHDQFALAKSTEFNIKNDQAQPLSCREFEGNIKQNWKLLSYSALVGHHEVSVKGATDEISFNNSDNNESGSESNEHHQQEMRFAFPKGANPGTCLHEMMENLDFTLPVSEQAKIIEESLLKYGIEASIPETANWIQEVVSAKIGDWSLSNLGSGMRLDEMEFYFNVQELSLNSVGNALRMCGFDDSRLNHSILSLESLQGQIKGFIDLTAMINGKFYIIDYKSNYLGEDYRDYLGINLKNAMTDHNYHLQLIIYSYALHKWLSIKLPDYDYNEHVAGGAYLFMRGMSPERPQAGVYEYKVPFEVIEYIDNALQFEVA